MGKFTFNKISSAVLNLLCAALEVPAAPNRSFEKRAFGL